LDSFEANLKALMLASIDGDAASYRVLLNELRVRLSRFFGRRLPSGSQDVEDLVQDTLMAIHTHRETYDQSQAFSPWAYAIARHKLIDHYRKAGRRVYVPLEDAGELFVDDASFAVEARRDIEHALERLPERTRALIRSAKLDERSNAEVAAESGMSESAVKVAIHRGLKILAAHLGRRSDGDDR
jgi:RNA polymerase sigma-70 factor (ECF subfamily)